MKHLHESLRQLKRIAPNSEYAASSRAKILASRTVAPRVTFASVFRGAGAFAMASLALVGCISLVRSVIPAAPVNETPLSQQTLAAEAERVDAQLALADVQYQAASEDEDGISPAALSIAKSAAGNSGGGEVDRALDALSR